MRVFIFLISFVFVLVSCEVPEGTSNRKLVRVGPPGKGRLVYRKRNNSFDEKFTADVFNRGLGPAVNDVVTPSYGGEMCYQVALSVTEIQDSSEIDLLVNEAFEKDASCKKVFTGNAGNTEAAGLPYAKTFAYSMIQDMCNPKSANVGELLSKPSLGYKDAMSLSLFNKG
ncbi:MAG: hypothetical protein KC478_17680, partial [Bacteriovoracaceae bacterium]|nr:hypothetical protein [Bacteriovoracaceae bacterium]